MTEVIKLDRRHRVVRMDDDWSLQARQIDGSYWAIEHWHGNRRSLMRKLEEHGIHPTREAEQQLAAMPERKAFGPDRD